MMRYTGGNQLPESCRVGLEPWILKFLNPGMERDKQLHARPQYEINEWSRNVDSDGRGGW